jgi:opacity protein-like surface antigen
MLKKNNALSVVIILIFCGLSGYAQQDLNNNNTTSPYSRYGLGDLHHYGYGRTAAMGGASLGSRHSIQINSANPASYSSNDSLSFVFEFGMDAKFSNYKSNTGSMKASDLNFRYFSLSFPISKRLGAGLGLQPYSDMGNEISYSEILPNIGNVSYKYIGEGTISKAYFGASVIPFKGLSLGANLNYIFGRINQNSTTNFDDATLFDLSSTEGTRLSDFTLSYGLQYDYKIKKNQYLTLGVTFETPSDVTAFHRLLSFKTITVGSGALVDTIQFKPESKDIIKLPSTIGVGLSYNKINKLEVNADYYYAGWSKSTFYGASDPVLTNQSRFSAGFEYIPEMFSIRSYVKRIKYRAGVHHENSYLILNNHQIKETGVSIGAGIPFPKSKSTANIAFELGKQGTTKDELVQNIYTKFSIYLNLYDYWFMKRKFD